MGSHKNTFKPSILLCLVCLAIVRRIRPQWVSIQLKDAACAEGISAQRLSRLCSGSIHLFENVISKTTQMGRPPIEQKDLTAELSLSCALLQVATEALSRRFLGKSKGKELLVGAYLKLKEQHPKLTQQSFCTHLAVPSRTLRHWLTQPKKAPTKTTEKKKPEPKPKLRRPRFGFEVTLPGTQMGADTTDFTAFGVGLKLMATQDIGGRDQNLFEAIIVDEHENADLVSQMLIDAVGKIRGIQVITDQGSPYLAEKTREVLDQLEVDHAPQKEGDPQGKATVEKAFDTIKRIAHPLLEITNRLAAAIQSLRKPDLARVMASVLFSALLRAYQAGARASRRAQNARVGLSEESLLELAARSREQAHAEDRSARLLLTRIHELYAIEQPLLSFIRNLRTFPLEVIKRAERAFGDQAQRDDIRKRGPYFAAIVRNINTDYQNQKARQRAEQEKQMLDRQIENDFDQRNSAWQQDPCQWLLAALEAIAHQWMPDKSMLLCGGRGLGLAWLKKSVARMIDLCGSATTLHLAAGVFAEFKNTHQPKIGVKGITSIQILLEKHLPKAGDKDMGCIKNLTSTILNQGPSSCSEPCRNC